jgi:hypothetical protein
MPPIRIAVVGSRTFDDYPLMCSTLDEIIVESFGGKAVIVSGGARGADSLASRYAREHGLKLQEYLPDYRVNGKKAPWIRNLQIVDDCRLLMAFWDGKSRGTFHAISAARKAGRFVRVVYAV